ncbi:lasso peptide biosynthesis B2 protein [Pseudoclavibacter helvolus]|uniref:lasso peptide biosynthesis B2 protein n=1 Tax=Pseudoclavibacter helvolus TaxID=255205 RepID=UPI0008397DF4|nr:lasso peptide biosynthesis B2 protein [Pseudoclavibacter helvolus]
MSLPLSAQPSITTRGRRALTVRCTVSVAFLITYARPRRIRRLLVELSRGARPSTREQAEAVRAEVCGVSERCAGEGCLQRSIATVLLCRLDGHAPNWCSGYRTGPFVAHAWVEADGMPVSEPPEVASYTRVLTTEQGRP